MHGPVVEEEEPQSRKSSRHHGHQQPRNGEETTMISLLDEDDIGGDGVQPVRKSLRDRAAKSNANEGITSLLNGGESRREASHNTRHSVAHSIRPSKADKLSAITSKGVDAEIISHDEDDEDHSPSNRPVTRQRHPPQSDADISPPDGARRNPPRHVIPVQRFADSPSQFPLKTASPRKSGSEPPPNPAVRTLRSGTVLSNPAEISEDETEEMKEMKELAKEMKALQDSGSPLVHLHKGRELRNLPHVDFGRYFPDVRSYFCPFPLRYFLFLILNLIPLFSLFTMQPTKRKGGEDFKMDDDDYLKRMTKKRRTDERASLGSPFHHNNEFAFHPLLFTVPTPLFTDHSA